MADLKIGMVGLDTSHCTAFAELLHDENNKYHVNGGRITVGYPGGSEEFSNSINRVEEYTSTLKEKYGVRIVDTVEEAAEEVDAVLLESVDGRQHLEQFRKLAPFGKPVFIDKPFATGADDARRILELSEKHGSPIFSCSAIRYASGVSELKPAGGAIGCDTYGPVSILEDYPGYFWYGIHCADMLFSKMGTGCVEVNVYNAETADVITGKWDGGRIGSIYGYRIKGVGEFGCTVFGAEGLMGGVAKWDPPFYAFLLKEIIGFFNSGVSPVSGREMLEITAFLESANISREKGGAAAINI